MIIVGLFPLNYSILFYSPKNSIKLHCAQTIKDKYPSLYQPLNLSKLRKEHLKQHLISIASSSKSKVKVPNISAIQVKTTSKSAKFNLIKHLQKRYNLFGAFSLFSYCFLQRQNNQF